MQRILDVWEGSLDIQEDVIYAGGIAGLIIRLNHITGGNHLDTNFTAQWEQAIRFLRAPYYVFNPWNSWKNNAEWLLDNLPKSGVTRIFSDVEVLYTGYTADVYADEVQNFINYVLTYYPLTVIYTGGWFLSYLSHWPANVPYWWARYPFVFYPDQKEVWTYQKLESETERYGYYPDPRKQCPSTVDLWQCSGDRIILPGCQNRPVDISLFNGTLEQLEAWWNAKLPNPPLTDKQKLDILWREASLQGWNLNP